MKEQFLALILSLLFLSGCSEAVEKTVAQSVSPNGAVTIEVRAQESWGYGPHRIRIFKVSGEGEALLEQTELSNDGANLGTHNARIEWTDENHVEVTLDGQEQQPQIHRYQI